MLGGAPQAWLLLDATKYRIKIEAAGTKIDDRLVHQLWFIRADQI